ncbi:FitA-like ribbon-helix-helix domain-containing protein [Solidesulfovibrio sp.]
MSTINVRNIPDDLHRAAKASAAKEGKTLQDWFIEAVKEKLEREKESK